MDFKKFERINNHSRKTSEIPTLLIRKDFIDTNKSTHDALETNIEHNQFHFNFDTINTSAFPNFSFHHLKSLNENEEMYWKIDKSFSIQEKIKTFESQMEEIETVNLRMSVLDIAKKHGLDADYNFLENFKIYNKNMNYTQHTNHTNFLAEIQLLFDNFENKLNSANIKINEILNENINLKVKNRLIEECSKQETISMKKMLNEALEKTKTEESGTTSQEKEENKKKSNLRINLQSIGHRKCSSYNYFPINGERDFLYGENLMLKMMRFEDRIEKLVTENEKLLEKSDNFDDLQKRFEMIVIENKNLNDKIDQLKQYEEKYKTLLSEYENVSEENSDLQRKCIIPLNLVNEENIKYLNLEEQLSDLKDLINNKESIKLCDMLIQLEEKVKTLESENLNLKEKILGKEDIITDLSQKYSEYHSHLTQLCEGMYFSTNTIDSPITDGSCNSDFSEELLSDLIVSNLYSSNKMENSLNFNLLNKGISKNFNFFLNSIFLTSGDNNSISILHEYLEDIFLRIYSFYLKKMLKTQGIDSKNDIWEINGKDLNEEDIQYISIDIYSNNILKLITNYFGYSKASNFDKLAERFLDKFSENMKNSDKKVKELLKSEGIINKKLNDKISKEKEDSISLVKELVKLCLENISSGKLCHKENVIYDFKKFYIEYLNLDKQNFESSFNFTINYDSHDTVDHFINSIKYKQHSLNSFYITTNLKSTIKLPLNKLVNHSIMYVPELKQFTLTEAILTINQVKSLAKLIRFSKLETLDLSNNKLGDTFVRILSEALKYNQILKVIYLSNNNITSLGGSYLAEAFQKNHSIEKVILGTNRINDYGLQGLVNSISINRTIKHLDISDNDLDYNDLIYLTNNLIPKNQSIEILNLSHNRFDPESVNDLGFSLKKNYSIKILELNSASLNEDSSPYFFKHLSGTNLSEIYLENNYLGEIGGILFSNVLRNNINLTSVSLKKCALNSVSLNCISKALDVNNTLKSLNLEENRFDDHSLLSLKGVIDKKLIKVSLSGSCLSTRSVDIIKQSTNLIIN